MEVQTGTCRASLERWYFSAQTGNCEAFEYGGCDGNRNNFASKAKCEAFCGVVTPRDNDSKIDCHLPAEVGPCRAAIQRYYFNPDSGQCEMFVFGGCSGNANNFATLKDCENQCKKSP